MQSLNSRAIMIVSLTVLGVIGSLLAGRMVATGQFTMMILVAAGFVALILGLSIGKYFWLMAVIPFWMAGSISVLPLPFNYAELGILAAFGLFLMHVAFKKQQLGFKMNWLDALLIFNLLYLLTVYVRNPVGTLSMGSDLVGGRSYFTLVISLLGYIVISHARVTPQLGYWLAAIIAFTTALPNVLIMLTEIFPPLGVVIWPFFSGVNIEAMRMDYTESSNPESGRITAFASIAIPIFTALCAYFPPSTLINPLYLGRFLALMACAVMVGFSGFRNTIAMMGMFLLIGAAIRRQFVSMYVILISGLIGVVLISVLHLAGAPVPLTFQRALSFIPLAWDERAKSAARGTTEWRQDMWKDAWEDPDIIRSKLLGDGFGYTRKEMMIISDTYLGIGGFMGTGNTYEAYLVKGSFHNGPLSAVKRVGLVGTFFLYILFVGVFVGCMRTIKQTKNTAFFPLAVFVSLPMLYMPFEFSFIFGDYEYAMQKLIFTVAILNLIRFSLPALEVEKARLASPKPDTAVPELVAAKA